MCLTNSRGVKKVCRQVVDLFDFGAEKIAASRSNLECRLYLI